MLTQTRKEQRRHDNAAKNMFRITDWLVGRSGNNFQILEQEPLYLLYEALSSKDPARLAELLHDFRAGGIFDGAESELEEAAYEHLIRSVLTVLDDEETAKRADEFRAARYAQEDAREKARAAEEQAAYEAWVAAEEAEKAKRAAELRAAREARKLCPLCGKPGLVVTGSRAAGLKHEHPPCGYLQHWAPRAAME